MSTRKFHIHLDAVIVLVLLFSVSIGAILHLWQENKRLFKANVEATWKAQNMETNWQYMQGLLEQCRESGARADVANGISQQ